MATEERGRGGSRAAGAWCRWAAAPKDILSPPTPPPPDAQTPDPPPSDNRPIPQTQPRQVDKAFDYLVQSLDADGPGARYAVSIASGAPAGAAEPR